MIKKEIYPKTKRVSCDGLKVEITEKLDGSNLCIFKKDDVLYVAQRRTILSFDELELHQKLLYKGLYQWLIDNREALNSIRNNSVVCGEWIGMGKLKYPDFDKRFFMFAKANIDDDFKLYNIIYCHDFFIYPFEECIVPESIGVVPVVITLSTVPTKEKLDELYATYSTGVDRNVEGFVVNFNNHITKYVRMKNGKLTDHFDRGE